mmetsp:Transcript_1462/g.3488  ORF Transcript_1462/g.3488 Transcript_1462/m.3488 type:complete len:93 (+) Transcript_1462:1914-2192(+)
MYTIKSNQSSRSAIDNQKLAHDYICFERINLLKIYNLQSIDTRCILSPKKRTKCPRWTADDLSLSSLKAYFCLLALRGSAAPSTDQQTKTNM